MKAGPKDLDIYAVIVHFQAYIDDNRFVTQQNVPLVWFSNLVLMN